MHVDADAVFGASDTSVVWPPEKPARMLDAYQLKGKLQPMSQNSFPDHRCRFEYQMQERRWY